MLDWQRRGQHYEEFLIVRKELDIRVIYKVSHDLCSPVFLGIIDHLFATQPGRLPHAWLVMALTQEFDLLACT